MKESTFSAYAVGWTYTEETFFILQQYWVTPQGEGNWRDISVVDDEN